MNPKMEIAIFLTIVIATFLIGCYFELRKNAWVTEAYLHQRTITHPNQPPPTTIPEPNDFTPLRDSAHELALIWISASGLFLILFFYYIFVERRKGI
jgi:hypothetical protein